MNRIEESFGLWKHDNIAQCENPRAFQSNKMATDQSRTEGNRLTPVLRIELSQVEELRERHCQNDKTSTKEKCDKRRKEYNKTLKEIEREINVAAGGEPYITLENRVDYEKFPEQFKYTRKNIPGPGVKIWPDPAYIVACDCKDRCTEKNCSCPVYSGSEFAYDEYGRVTLERRRPIYECNMKCPCRQSCRNRVVQRGRRVRVCIFRTKKKGWGLKTLDFIRANQFVTEYVGEILTSEDAETRGQKYDKMGQTYLFDLDYNEGDCLYTIDAYRHGNVAHFINHSCDPNLIVYGAWTDNVDPHLPHIALFATRDIQQGEELTFDYLMTGNNQSPSKSTRRMKCQCKSANCRKWLC